MGVVWRGVALQGCRSATMHMRDKPFRELYDSATAAWVCFGKLAGWAVRWRSNGHGWLEFAFVVVVVVVVVVVPCRAVVVGPGTSRLYVICLGRWQ